MMKVIFEVFRKLHTPAAPHPGYLISEDQRDGDIQALLGAAEKLNNSNKNKKQKNLIKNI